MSSQNKLLSDDQTPTRQTSIQHAQEVAGAKANLSASVEDRIALILRKSQVALSETMPGLTAIASVRVDGTAWFPETVPQLKLRTRNVLYQRGIATFGDLRQYTMIDIMALPNFGVVSAHDLLGTAIRLIDQASTLAVGDRWPLCSAEGDREAKKKSRQSPNADRDVEIVNKRNAGMTLEAIASELGLSRERVRQICKRHGATPSTALRQDAKQRKRDERANLSGKISDYLLERPGATRAELAAAFDVEQSEVNGLVPVKYKRLLQNESSEGLSQQWSDQDIFSALRTAATYEFPLSVAKYSFLLEIGEITGPSAPRLHQRFGSWSRACELAGVEHGTSNIDYSSLWTDDDIIRFVVMYLDDDEFLGSAPGYEEWRRGKHDDAPSFGTIRNRFGDWTAVKEIAFAEMRRRRSVGDINHG